MAELHQFAVDGEIRPSRLDRRRRRARLGDLVPLRLGHAQHKLGEEHLGQLRSQRLRPRLEESGSVAGT